MIDISKEDHWEEKVRDMLCEHFGVGTSFTVVAWTNEAIGVLTVNDGTVWPPAALALTHALKMQIESHENDPDTVH